MQRSSTRPTGVVTFLFTDIEGSTGMWDRAPDAMTGALARHDEMVYAAIESHHGLVFKHTGDGVCAVFQEPHDALQAALQVQEAFRAEAFPTIGRMAVRIAIHTEEAEELEGDYRGPALNRVARLLDVAVGGDILLTNAAEAMMRATLPRSVELGDLGQKRLRGISEPGRVYSVGTSSRRRSRRAGPWLAGAAALAIVTAAIAVLSLATPPGTRTPETTAAPAASEPGAPARPVPETTGDAAVPWVARPGGALVALVAHEDVVIAASESTGLHAYRAVDGGQFWPEQGLIVDLDQPLVEPFGAPVSGVPAIGDGIAVYATSLGTLHAVELAGGSLRWWHRFERCLGDDCTPVVPSRPVLHDETVFVAAGGDLFRFAVESGESMQAVGGFGSISAGPAAGGEHLYVAEGQTLLQYRTTDLSLVQTIFVGEGVPVGYRAGITSIVAPAMPAGTGLQHALFLTDEAGFLTRRSPETGMLHPDWTDSTGEPARIPAATKPVVGTGSAGSDPVLWIVDPAGTLLGIDAATGSRVAEHPVGQTDRSVAIGRSGTVFVATDTPELIGYDPTAGSESFRVPLPSAPRTDPVEVEGTVFVGDVDEVVRAYTSEGKEVVEAPPPPPGWLAGSVSDVAWSPEGSLAFVFEGDVWVTDVAVSELVNLTARTGGGSAPDWSPSGDRIAYVSGTGGQDLYVIESNGSGRRNLTNTPAVDESDPSWSPDGRWIAFGWRPCIVAQNPSTERLCSTESGLRRIAVDEDRVEEIGGTGAPASDGEPDWIPGGDGLAFVSDRTPDDGSGATRHVWTMVLDGTEPEVLGGTAPATGRAPTVSPDGQRVALVSGESPAGLSTVEVIRIGDEVSEVLPQLPIGAGPPTWSPDGTRLAFAWEQSALGRIYTISTG